MLHEYFPSYKEEAIEFTYPAVSPAELQYIKEKSKVCLLENTDNVIIENSYYQDGLPGTQKQVYCREIVFERLQRILKLLSPHFGFIIFDAFRTFQTQTALYEDLLKKLDNNKAAVEEFIARPEKIGGYVSPHATGCAIDLSIYELKDRKPCDFGSGFDAFTEVSHTDFFEQAYQANLGYSERQWNEIKYNRRVLFNLMKEQGFVNFRNEWWHYDLGDRVWAQILNVDWSFPSMEEACKLFGKSSSA